MDTVRFSKLGGSRDLPNSFAILLFEPYLPAVMLDLVFVAIYYLQTLYQTCLAP